MPKYEAIVDLTIEVSANSPEEADKLIFGEMTERLLHTASRDNKYKLWLDVRQIEQIEEQK